MIVAERKPFVEIKEFLAPYQKVMILGCGTCVTVCQAGGQAEVDILTSELKIADRREGKSREFITGTVTRQCEPEMVEPILEQVKRDQPEAILTLACGVGCNFLAERVGKVPVFPGVNTSFYGTALEHGVFAEMCAGCGQCILHLTGGICPIARCTKSLMNGPCGGSNKGKCEISTEVDCGWALIVKRMEDLGTLDKLTEIYPVRDWSKSFHGGPRKLLIPSVKIAAELAAQAEEAKKPGAKS
jgi:ferredoxin